MTMMSDARRVRRASTYGSGPCAQIGAGEASRLVARLRDVIEATRRIGGKGRRGEGRGSSMVAVYNLLVRWRSQDGSRYPSIETIAERARVGRSSVTRAIAELEDRGLIRRVRRLRHQIIDGVRRSCVASNAYLIVRNLPDDQNEVVLREADLRRRALREERDRQRVRQGVGGVIVETTKRHMEPVAIAGTLCRSLAGLTAGREINLAFLLLAAAEGPNADGFYGASMVLLALSASALGLGALLLAMPRLFDVVRYAGAAYLVWLGIKAWRGAGKAGAGLDPELPVAGPRTPAYRLYIDALLTGLSNPKLILFAAAFFPQFIARTAPAVPQFGILVATFATIETSWYATYAAGGRRLARWLASPSRQKLFDRATGGLFMAFGAGLVVARV